MLLSAKKKDMKMGIWARGKMILLRGLHLCFSNKAFICFAYRSLRVGSA